MTEWKKYRIKDISKKINSGGTPKSSEKSFYDGTIPWLNTKEIDFNRIRKTERCITDEGFANSSAKWIPKGSVIVAMYGATAAKVAYSLIDLTTNQACCNMIVDDTIADSQFVYYYIQSSYQELLNLACGAAQQNLSLGVIADFPILLPPLDTQRRIASILSSLDDKIDLLRRENTTLEAMAETLFRQWFVEEAKEEWEDVLLGDLIDIGSGKGLQRSEFVENGLYSILGANGEIGKTNKYLVSESDRVIYTGRVGTLGNVFRIENKKAWLSDNTLVVRPKDYYYFVYFVLKCARLQDFNVGSTQPLIRQSDIKEIEISLPDGNSLKAFEKECNDLYKKIDSNNNQIQTLIQTRDELLPRLMGGEVKI